jgi:hypothetical protein
MTHLQLRKRPCTVCPRLFIACVLLGRFATLFRAAFRLVSCILRSQDCLLLLRTNQLVQVIEQSHGMLMVGKEEDILSVGRVKGASNREHFFEVQSDWPSHNTKRERVCGEIALQRRIQYSTLLNFPAFLFDCYFAAARRRLSFRR